MGRAMRERLSELEARKGEVKVIMDKARVMMARGEKVMERGRRWQAAREELTALERRVAAARAAAREAEEALEGVVQEGNLRWQERVRLGEERAGLERQLRVLQRKVDMEEGNVRQFEKEVEAAVLWDAGESCWLGVGRR